MRLRTWFKGVAALSCGVMVNATGAPLITEFSASNRGELYDEDGETSDWIEIHNPDAAPVDLSGYALTNDAGDLEGWALPAVTLPAGGYLVVFASGKDRDVGELHTDFRLARSGGYLGLVEEEGQAVVSSYPSYPEQPSGFSYGLAQSGSSEVLTWIPENAACKILVPTEEIGTSWRNLGFDDGAWDDGNTGVGYEDSSGYENLIGANGDVGAEMIDTTGTAYVRLPFLVDDLDGITKLTLRMKYDDGFVAFLNGTRVADGNPPTGALAFDSEAGADHTDSLATVFEDTDLTPFLGDLVVGNNVLAIHGLNNGTGSSDFLILPELNAERVTNPGLGDEGYFGNPSPGAVNGSSADQGLPAGDVVFSVPGRGYTGTVSLQLSTESAAAQIRYTTNGNVPTAGSTLYSGPITISQSTLVRARAFESGKAPGAIGEEGYIELASSAANFSSDVAVVVMERFSGGPTAANGKQFSFFAFFEPDPVSGRTTLNKPYALGTRGGWKTRGSSSSGFPKKAYSMEAWNELNENKNISPFGMPRESDWILSARYTFDRALMRNPLIYRLSNEVGRYAVRTKFVELFKNDNGGNLSYGTGSNQDYDGVYTFMEKIARDEDRVDVERLPASVTSEPGIAGGYMLKIDRLDPGDSGLNAGGRTMGWVYPKERNVTAEQTAWIRNYLNAMNDALNGADFADPVNGYEKYIDVDSWIDHHLLNVLTLNADALRLSTYFYKTRSGKVEFGPIWDFDRSMESTDGRDDNPLTWNGGTNYFGFQWWTRLFDDDNFRQRYIDRFFELREGPFSTANVQGIIDEFAAELNESQVRNFNRWSGARPRFGSYQGEVNHLKDWLTRRLAWMDAQFVGKASSNRPAGVYPAGTTVTLSANLAGGRRIMYTLDGSDPRPSNSGAGTILSQTTLVDEDAASRVWIPTSDIGAAWRGGSEPFNDGSWIAGVNGMGYDEATTYDDTINVNLEGAGREMNGVSTSAYMRIEFDLDPGDLAGTNFMRLGMKYDDGFVAYLNGVRIAGANDPAGLTWNGGATGTHDDSVAESFEAFDATAHVGELRAGRNVLAIHGLNAGLGSSDFLIQAELTVGVIEFPDGGGAGGVPYTGPITLDESARLVVRVQDPSGGPSSPTATGWSAPITLDYLIDEVPADETSLVVSEIMHEPYPLGDAVTGRGEFEFFEVLNVGDERISLNDVRVTDGVAFDFSGARIRSLAPGERAVVVKNRAAFAQVYGTAALERVAGEYLGSLANGGELLELRDVGGAVIREVDYLGDATWVGDEEGRALVLTGNGDPDEGANWSLGGSLLGTPGTDEVAGLGVVVNEVLTNSVVPEVDLIELWNTSGAAVDVGGWFLTDDLGQPEKFRIPDGTTIAEGGYLVFTEADFNPTPGAAGGFALSSAGEEVFLVAAEADGARLGYVDGFEFGDASAGVPFGRHVLSTGEVVVAPFDGLTPGLGNTVPRYGPLVIEELMYHPADGGVEFIELRNLRAVPVPLAGVEISGVGWVFGALAPELEGGGVVLLVEIDPEVFRAAYGVPDEVAIYGPLPGKLDNGGETVTVRLPEADPEGGGVLMVESDRVRYDDDAPWPSSADGGGVSLQRSQFLGYGSEPRNWGVSRLAGGTPGSLPVPEGDWREAFFTAEELADPTISGFLADADSDGSANLLEYVLGSDLRDGGDVAQLGVEVVEDGGRAFLEVSYRLRREREGLFLVSIETSVDGIRWSLDSGFREVSRASNGDGTETVVSRSSDEVGEAPVLLARVSVVEVTAEP